LDPTVEKNWNFLIGRYGRFRPFMRLHLLVSGYRTSEALGFIQFVALARSSSFSASIRLLG
jgi:hypothetical protein